MLKKKDENMFKQNETEWNRMSRKKYKSYQHGEMGRGEGWLEMVFSWLFFFYVGLAFE